MSDVREVLGKVVKTANAGRWTPLRDIFGAYLGKGGRALADRCVAVGVRDMGARRRLVKGRVEYEVELRDTWHDS